MRSVHIPLILRLLYTIPSVSLSVLRDNIILIVFSEGVVNFTADDIEITGGTITDFVGNGREFRATVNTATSAEVYVPAGVCRSENGVLNTESSRLTYHA